jgi:hypothetical protein
MALVSWSTPQSGRPYDQGLTWPVGWVQDVYFSVMEQTRVSRVRKVAIPSRMASSDLPAIIGINGIPAWFSEQRKYASEQRKYAYGCERSRRRRSIYLKRANARGSLALIVALRFFSNLTTLTAGDSAPMLAIIALGMAAHPAYNCAFAVRGPRRAISTIEREVV